MAGGGGQVGRAVVQCAPEHAVVFTKTRQDLDICSEAAVLSALESSGAQWLINAAAYTAVDLAEDDRDAARAVNETAVGVLARAALASRCRLLHLSTDFVFDGETNRAYLPTDRTNPLGVYGSTKLVGETLASQGGNAVVVRTAWVYASEGRNFVLTMLRLMRERPEVRVVCDQIGTPTWASSLARALWSLINGDVPSGTYHWTDLGVASWYDFAVAIQEEAILRGLLTRAVPIVPIKSSSYPTRAKRPAFSVLDTESTRSMISLPACHWRNSLRTMLDELRPA